MKNKEFPTISVIIPVYNTEKYLENCLKSVVNQSYKNLEIIIVNDGSTDNSLKICKEFAAINSRIQIISKGNGGISSARNLGLEKCSGDYVSFIDSDDWIHPETYQKLIPFLINPVDLVVFNFLCFYAYTPHWQLPESTIASELNKHELFNNYLERGFYVWRNLYNINILKNIYFDEQVLFLEDVYFGIKIFNQVNNSIFVDIPLVAYNESNVSSLTRSTYKKGHFNTIDANIQLLNFAKKEFPKDKRVLEKLRIRLLDNCFYHAVNIAEHEVTDSKMKSTTKNVFKKNFNFSGEININYLLFFIFGFYFIQLKRWIKFK